MLKYFMMKIFSGVSRLDFGHRSDKVPVVLNFLKPNQA